MNVDLYQDYGHKISPICEPLGQCPKCGATDVHCSYKVGGMWTLITHVCTQCSHEFFGEPPYGLGLFQVNLVSQGAQEFQDNWYVASLRKYNLMESKESRNITIHGTKKTENAWFANCLHSWIGDSVSLVFRLGLLKHSNLDVVCLVPKRLESLLAHFDYRFIYVDGTLDYLDCFDSNIGDQVSKVLSEYNEVRVPYIHQPALRSGDQPSVEIAAPNILFHLRNDRAWSDFSRETWSIYGSWFIKKIARSRFGKWIDLISSQQESRRIRKTIELLKRMLPTAKIAISGIGQPKQSKLKVADYRSCNPNPQEIRKWHSLASDASVIISVHGSHVTDISTQCNRIISLVPASRETNLWQDVIHGECSGRGYLFKYRSLPLSTKPLELAVIVANVILNSGKLEKSFSDAEYRPLQRDEVDQIRNQLTIRECQAVEHGVSGRRYFAEP